MRQVIVSQDYLGVATAKLLRELAFVLHYDCRDVESTLTESSGHKLRVELIVFNV
jgi:hypothetical protein